MLQDYECTSTYLHTNKMYCPKLYLSGNQEIITRSEHFLKKYFHLVHQSKEKKKVLDIGSGPGNVTHDILYPFFKFDVDEVIGIDMSKPMVRYANSRYKNDKFSFRLFDICNNDLGDLVERFDYVFSFWALQWIQDQRTLFSNIYKMMKPNSDLLFWTVARSELYNVYRIVWFKPEYIKYITNFSSLEPTFHRSTDPVNELTTILEKVGFEVRLCKVSNWRLQDMPEFRDFLISINSAYDQIPEDLQQKFIEDHLKEMIKNGSFMHEGQFIIDYDMFIVHAKKNQK